MNVTFEAYRRLCLKELTKVRVYPNFHQCVRAFETVGGLEKFAESLCPLLKTFWKNKWKIEDAARRLDNLTQANMMAGMLYNAEVESERKKER